MSRIGRKPVTIPAGVTITLDGTKVTVKGPKGTLERNIDKHLSVKIEGTELLVTRPDDSISMKMIHGTTRALIQNMVDGVSNGFSKDLEIRGVGYKCKERTLFFTSDTHMPIQSYLLKALLFPLERICPSR